MVSIYGMGDEYDTRDERMVRKGAAKRTRYNNACNRTYRKSDRRDQKTEYDQSTSIFEDWYNLENASASYEAKEQRKAQRKRALKNQGEQFYVVSTEEQPFVEEYSEPVETYDQPKERKNISKITKTQVHRQIGGGRRGHRWAKPRTYEDFPPQRHLLKSQVKPLYGLWL